jgi:acyl-CoA synthetase (NDP forming)
MSYDGETVREILDKVRAEGREALTAPEGKRVCDAYGIPTPGEGLAATAAETVALAEKIGFPVVLKIVSPDILHKTEAGGVLVGVADPAAASAGFDTIIANAKKYNATAQIDGVQVQQMIGGGHEVIIGAVTDQTFGKVVAFGLGGWPRWIRPRRCPCWTASRRPRCSRAPAAPSRSTPTRSPT